MEPLPLRFIPHALERLAFVESQGFGIDEGFVEAAIRGPEKIDIGHGGRVIYQKRIDQDHVLRVICELATDEIVVVTLYPGRVERYG